MNRVDKAGLLRCFQYAEKNNQNYILVEIQIEDYPEVEIILIKNENFADKIKYYIVNYNEQLQLKHNNSIEIVNFYSFNKFKIED